MRAVTYRSGARMHAFALEYVKDAGMSSVYTEYTMGCWKICAPTLAKEATSHTPHAGFLIS
jgi:hypothetical protein